MFFFSEITGLWNSTSVPPLHTWNITQMNMMFTEQEVILSLQKQLLDKVHLLLEDDLLSVAVIILEIRLQTEEDFEVFNDYSIFVEISNLHKIKCVNLLLLLVNLFYVQYSIEILTLGYRILNALFSLLYNHVKFFVRNTKYLHCC